MNNGNTGIDVNRNQKRCRRSHRICLFDKYKSKIISYELKRNSYLLNKLQLTMSDKIVISISKVAIIQV